MKNKRLISENDIRRIIREAVIKEVTNFGRARFRGVEFEPCDIEIPPELKSIFEYATAGGKSGRGIDALPAFQKMFPGVSGITDGVVNSLDTIMGYLNTGLNMAGMTNLSCTMINIAMEMFGSLLMSLGLIEAGQKYGKYAAEGNEQTRSLSVSFDQEIREYAQSNASGNLREYSSLYPFYVLPASAKSSSTSLNAKDLTEDTGNYIQMMNSVRSASESSAAVTLESVSSAMKVKLDNDQYSALKSIPPNTKGLKAQSYAIKAQAIKDMQYAAGKAVQHYRGTSAQNSIESSLLESFLTDVIKFSV